LNVAQTAAGMMAGIGEAVIVVGDKASFGHAEGCPASAGALRPRSLGEALTRALPLGSA
jgi:hypothetical protein